MKRRNFLKKFGFGVAAGLASKPLFSAQSAHAADIVRNTDSREALGLLTNAKAADRAYRLNSDFKNNNEESDFPFIANFTKGLRHDNFTGEVVAADYRRYLKALREADFDILENLEIGSRGLANPQAGLALSLKGPDSHKFRMRPAPRIDSAHNSAEMVELYWMALTRDINFEDYATDPLIARAIVDLNRLSDFRGPEPKWVLPSNMYRGDTLGDLRGPYVSQFLYRDIAAGSFLNTQRQRYYQAGVNYLTNFEDWLFVQNGNKFFDNQPYANDQKYIRNGRDLAAHVFEDEIFQSFYNAALILTEDDSILDAGLPYNFLTGSQGFVTFGLAHLLSLISEAAYTGLKAMWFQKWYVHRRARPEEFGGRIHQHLTGVADYSMIDSEVLNSDALQETFSQQGSYFLSQAYNIGSPMHPAYGAGHAVIAGACGTILKAFFDESQQIANPMVSNSDGTALIPYTGSDRETLTVGSEIDKLVGNISMGRNFAGIHWRTDYTYAIKLGERSAMQLLRQQNKLQVEKHRFSLTKYNGKRVSISSRGIDNDEL